MSCLLNDGSKCKDAINGLVLESKSSMSSSSKLPPLKLPKEIQIEDRSKEFGKHMAYHDHHVVVGIHTRARFVNWVDHVM
jgi:hypothetical protein